MAGDASLLSVAERTRRLHPCRTCREDDRHRPARPLCYPKWLTLILWRVRPSLAPAYFPTPLPALGPTTISTDAPVPGRGFKVTGPGPTKPRSDPNSHGVKT